MPEIINPCRVQGIGDLIDCSDEQFKEHFKDKNLSYCLNAYKLFNLTFEQLGKMIKDLEKQAEVEKDENKKKDYVNTMKALFVNLGYIEHKATLLLTDLKSRKIKD